VAEISGKLTAEVEEVDVEAVVVVGLEVEEAVVVATATVGTLGEIVVEEEGEEEVTTTTDTIVMEAGMDGVAIVDLIKMVGEEATAQGPSKVMNGNVSLAMNNN
jgi:hypothetical protein